MQKLTYSSVLLCLPFAASILFSGCSSFGRYYYPSLPASAIPQVVAVSSFDNRSGFAGEWQLGSGMADLLASELMQSENYILVERGNLQDVIRELNLQTDKHFRSEGKVEAGRLKNARYLIRGVINDFSQVGGSSFAVALRKLFFGGRGYVARVALTMTIVDVESGEVLDAVQCAGTARAGDIYAKTEYKGIAFGGDAFFKTPLGEATREAISAGVRKIIAKTPVVYWEPMIAELAVNNRIVVNGGKDRGMKIGKIFEARDSGKVITDPATGDKLSVIPGAAIGRIKITKVEDRISFAEAISGQGFKRGHRLLATE